MIKYIHIRLIYKQFLTFFAISFFIILSACQDNAPTDCNCVKIIYDTTNFDLSVSLNTINKFDEMNYYKNGIRDQDSIRIQLYKNNILINEVFSNKGSYYFEKLDKKATYKLKYEKEGFITFDTTLSNLQYNRRKSFDYEVVRHSDYINISNTIYEPFVPTKIKSIEGKFLSDSLKMDSQDPMLYFYRFYALVYFNEARIYNKAVISVSSEPNFLEDKCIVYNKIYDAMDKISIFIDEFQYKRYKKGDKIYIKAYPILNGVYRNINSEELGEPVYFEAVAE